MQRKQFNRKEFNNMIKTIVLVILLIFFSVLLVVNEVKGRMNKKKYQNILQYMNYKKNYINSDKIELCKKEEWYKDYEFFKMKNNGTSPDEHTDVIEYNKIYNESELYIDRLDRANDKENRLKPMIEELWILLLDGAKAMQIRDDNIKINESKNTFSSIFEDLYYNISNNYMQTPDEALDRHKIASIYIVSIIKSQILQEKEKTELVFLGNYVLATDCGMLYMMFELNKRLEAKGLDKINKYIFPMAMSCETDYYRIFYRNLYFSDTNSEWKLNPIDIAERLFLLEYLTLEKNEIDPCILKEQLVTNSST